MADFEAQKRENEERILEDEIRNRAEPTALPPWIGLHTTTRCNLKCVFCLQADGLMPKRTMDEAVFGHAARELFPTARVVQLSASGEPFMTPRIREILDVIAWYGAKLEVITNATLLDDDLIARTVDIADTFNFSVDGATKETFEKLRVGARFDRVMDNIIKWNRRRLLQPFRDRGRLAFKFILMRQTIREAEALVDICHALRGDEVAFCHLSEHREEVRGDALYASKAESNHYMERARERAIRLGVRFSAPHPFHLDEAGLEAAPASWPEPVPAPPELLEKIHASIPDRCDPGGADIDRWWTSSLPPLPDDSPRCYFLWRRTFIDPDGGVIPCFHPDAYALGNIRENSFWRIWTSPAYAEYRRKVYEEEPQPICRNCFIIRKSGRRKAIFDAALHNEAS